MSRTTRTGAPAGACPLVAAALLLPGAAGSVVTPVRAPAEGAIT